MKPPTPSQQRYFGISVAAALLMLSWITWRAVASPWLSGAIAGAGGLFAVVYYAIPTSQPNLIAFFRATTFPIQWTMTLIVLAIVYYVVLMPISIWFRVSGRSIRDADADAKSNWAPIDLPADHDSYFRTF